MFLRGTRSGRNARVVATGAAEQGWTPGCVALDDPDIAELFAAVPLGTPVRILP